MRVITILSSYLNKRIYAYVAKCLIDSYKKMMFIIWVKKNDYVHSNRKSTLIEVGTHTLIYMTFSNK